MLFSVHEDDHNLDDDLIARATEVTGIRERSQLVHDGLRALISREAARRLIALGGSEPNLVAPPRRRPTRPTSRGW